MLLDLFENQHVKKHETAIIDKIFEATHSNQETKRVVQDFIITFLKQWGIDEELTENFAREAINKHYENNVLKAFALGGQSVSLVTILLFYSYSYCFCSFLLPNRPTGWGKKLLPFWERVTVS